MSIAIATPLLFLMARFPPYRDAAPCWASSASPASTYCSTPLWPTSQPPRKPGNPVAGGGTGLAEARLPSRRRGGLPHLGAVAVRPQPLLATPTIPTRAVYTVLMNRHASAVQPCRGHGVGLLFRTGRRVAYRRRLQAGNPGPPPRLRPSGLQSCGVAPNAGPHLLGEALTATQLIGVAVAVAGVYISARG
jgi:hypothetical protein